MKKVIKQTTTAMHTTKPYVPAPHPQQARIDAVRIVPSLVTTNPENAPKGK
jgi:hypothetical protein